MFSKFSLRHIRLAAAALLLCSTAGVPAADKCELPRKITVNAPDALLPSLKDFTGLLTADGREVVAVDAPEEAFLRFAVSSEGTPEHRQGYLLEIAKDGIAVRARTPEGLFNGWQALCDLLRRSADGTLPLRRVAETPAFAERALCFSVVSSATGKDFDRLKQRLRVLAALRCNRVILEFGDRIDEAAVKGVVTRAQRYFIRIAPVSRGWKKCPRNADDRELVRAEFRRSRALLRPDEYFFRLDWNELETHRRSCPECRGAAPQALLAGHLDSLVRCAAEAGIRPAFIMSDFPAELDAAIPGMLPAGTPLYGLKTGGRTPDAAPAGDAAMLREIASAHRRDAKRFILLAAPHVRNGELAGPLSDTSPAFLGGAVQGFFALWSPEHSALPEDPVRYFNLLHTGNTQRRDFRTATPVAIWPQLTAELGSTGAFPRFADQNAVEAMRRELRELPERFEIAVCFGGRWYGALLAGSAESELPERVEIPLGGVKTGALALLVSCSTPAAARNDGLAFDYFDVASVRIRYDDGETILRPLKYRRHISGWDERFGGYDRRTAFVGRDAQGRSIRFDAVTIRNPHPEKPITGLTFLSFRAHGAAPVLLALSLLDMTDGALPAADLCDELLRINFRPPAK